MRRRARRRGRFFTVPATQTIVKMAAAQGVARVVVGRNALLSTPAVSATIRELAPACLGGIILTASHNPGGEHGDFGVKFNTPNGGPAPEEVTEAIFAASKRVTSFRTCAGLGEVDLSKEGRVVFEGAGGGGWGGRFEVEVVDPTEVYTRVVSACFDMDKIRALVRRSDFSLVFDGMHGVTGPYARRLLVEELGAPESSLLRCDPLPDFGGGHPDPNLTYAEDLVRRMGLNADGTVAEAEESEVARIPAFGAASDGDGDRGMFLGKRFFVSPSDSLAVIAANADAIKLFREAGGLRGAARSMPTSGALDHVVRVRNEAADELGKEAAKTHLFVVPTGWKFFSSLMDSHPVYGKAEYRPFLCGEESFGTGSSHVREKDGLWGVLAWLSILAYWNQDTPVGALVGVENIVRTHWNEFGRSYYRRLDFEGVDSKGAADMIAHLTALAKDHAAVALHPTFGDLVLDSADEFNYTDPVTGAVADKQGLQFFFRPGARVVFRLSGTGSSGATVRIYVEQYEAPLESDDASTEKLGRDAGLVLAPAIRAALLLARIKDFVGTDIPTVIT